MTTALFPEMAQSAFQPLLGRLRNGARDQVFSLDEARGLIIASGLAATVMDKSWEAVQGLVHQGIEGRKLASLLGEIAQLLDVVLFEVYPQVRSIVASEILPSDEKQAGLQSLDDFRVRATSIRKDLESLRSFVDAPPRVDLAKVMAQANVTRGSGNETVEAILTRLRAGGDI